MDNVEISGGNLINQDPKILPEERGKLLRTVCPRVEATAYDRDDQPMNLGKAAWAIPLPKLGDDMNVTVGRHREEPTVNVSLERGGESQTSRLHALFLIEFGPGPDGRTIADRAAIRDLESTNGTYVGKGVGPIEKLEKGGASEIALGHLNPNGRFGGGTKIWFGDLTRTFVLYGNSSGLRIGDKDSSLRPVLVLVEKEG